MKNFTYAKFRKIINNIFSHSFLLVLVLVWIAPLVWILLTSFRGEQGLYSTEIIPKTLTLSNYTRLFTETEIFNFGLWFVNTLIVSICSCLISAFYTLAVAYAMSRARFKMRKPFMNIALIMGLFPGFMSMIAVYYILKGVGLTEGYFILVALVLVYSGSAGLGFYIAKGYFDTIPRAIDEAAIIDGASKWDVFTKITIPLSKPIIVQTVIASFLAPWADFIFAKVIAGSNARYYTVSVGLFEMLSRENVNQFFTRFAAGAVLVSIPMVILFLSIQRYYSEGNSGAVKG